MSHGERQILYNFIVFEIKNKPQKQIRLVVTGGE